MPSVPVHDRFNHNRNFAIVEFAYLYSSNFLPELY